MRILIAEDESTLRAVIRQVLSADGFEVTEASSGEEALEYFRSDPFPVVFSDIVMGRLSGLDLLAAIREISPDCVFVIMTSHASIETATAALRSGAYDFLIKPFDDIDVLSNLAVKAAEKARSVEDSRRKVEILQRCGQELQRLNVELQELANRDDLTGLNNRRYFLETLDREIARSRRHGRHLSVIMFDVDRFKRFNDTFGHLAGDEALRAMARVLKDNLRACHVAARYGGEEFVILATETDKPGGMIFAERLRNQIRETAITGPAGEALPSLTISIGVATYDEDGSDSTALIGAADAALYRAKEAGRDRVCAAEPVREPTPADQRV